VRVEVDSDDEPDDTLRWPVESGDHVGVRDTVMSCEPCSDDDRESTGMVCSSPLGGVVELEYDMAASERPVCSCALVYSVVTRGIVIEGLIVCEMCLLTG